MWASGGREAIWDREREELESTDFHAEDEYVRREDASRRSPREVFSDEGSGCRIREMARAAREKRRAKGGMTFMELRVVGRIAEVWRGISWKEGPAD